MKLKWESTGYRCETRHGAFQVQWGYGDHEWPVSRYLGNGRVEWLGGMRGGLPHFYPSLQAAMTAVELRVYSRICG